MDNIIAGNTLITLIEPKYKKHKGYQHDGNWLPGNWYRGDRLPGMWETSARGLGVRVAKYRKNLIKNKIPFTEVTHAPGKTPGFDEQSVVVEFIFYKEVKSG